MTLECLIAEYLVVVASGPTNCDLESFAASVPDGLKRDFLDWLLLYAVEVERLDLTLN